MSKHEIVTYTCTVDYGITIEEAVRRGHYNYADANITSQNFSTKQKGKVERVMELIHFDCYISTNEILKEFDRMGYRPAELHELLAFGEQHPDVQRKFPVVALGPVWRRPDGYRLVPCLWGGTDNRGLGLHWFGGGWVSGFRFIVCRE